MEKLLKILEGLADGVGTYTPSIRNAIYEVGEMLKDKYILMKNDMSKMELDLRWTKESLTRLNGLEKLEAENQKLLDELNSTQSYADHGWKECNKYMDKYQDMEQEVVKLKAMLQNVGLDPDGSNLVFPKDTEKPLFIPDKNTPTTEEFFNKLGEIWGDKFEEMARNELENHLQNGKIADKPDDLFGDQFKQVIKEEFRSNPTTEAVSIKEPVWTEKEWDQLNDFERGIQEELGNHPQNNGTVFVDPDKV